MKVGDKVKMVTYKNKVAYSPYSYSAAETWYTIVEIYDESIKVKHPDIGGHFVFRRDNVLEIMNESG